MQTYKKRFQMKKVEEVHELTNEEKEEMIEELLNEHHRVYDRLAEI